MGIVQLPVGRGRGELERSALQRALPSVKPAPVSLRVLSRRPSEHSAYCAASAGPIEFGAVVRAEERYCSIESSLGGNPA